MNLLVSTKFTLVWYNAIKVKRSLDYVRQLF